MSDRQPGLFPLAGIPKQCEAALCRELAAAGDILCPPHRARHRDSLLGICISCRKWMDDPERWGYNCAGCAHHQNPTVNRRLKRKYEGSLYGKQQGRCANCRRPVAIGKGRIPDDIPIDLDHIRPRSRGGRDNRENLQLLCQTCNRRKGNMPEADFKTTKPATKMDL